MKLTIIHNHEGSTDLKLNDPVKVGTKRIGMLRGEAERREERNANVVIKYKKWVACFSFFLVIINKKLETDGERRDVRGFIYLGKK